MKIKKPYDITGYEHLVRRVVSQKRNAPDPGVKYQGKTSNNWFNKGSGKKIAMSKWAYSKRKRSGTGPINDG